MDSKSESIRHLANSNRLNIERFNPQNLLTLLVQREQAVDNMDFTDTDINLQMFEYINYINRQIAEMLNLPNVIDTNKYKHCLFEVSIYRKEKIAEYMEHQRIANDKHLERLLKIKAEECTEKQMNINS